jgi:hypothetical protein
MSKVDTYEHYRGLDMSHEPKCDVHLATATRHMAGYARYQSVQLAHNEGTHMWPRFTMLLHEAGSVPVS